MTTAREIMHVGVTCIGEHETLQDAAQQMRDLDVGSLPVCGDDDRLRGIITDRDIVTKCIARGVDPANVTAGELTDGIPVTIEPHADVTGSCAPWSNTRSTGYRSSRASSRSA